MEIELYESLIDDLSLGILVIDPTGRIILANRAIKSLVGDPQKDLTGIHFKDLIGGFYLSGGISVDADEKPLDYEDHPIIRALNDPEFSGSDIVGIKHNSSDIIWLKVSCHHIIRGGIRAIAATVREITKQRNIEQEIKSKLSENKLIFDALDCALLLINSAGEIAFYNKGAENLLDDISIAGENFDGFLSQLFDKYRVWNEDETPLGKDEFPPTISLKSAKSIKGKVFGIQRKGAVRWLELDSVAIADDELYAVVVTIYDITARNAQELELEKAVTDLAAEREFLKVLLDNLDEGIIAVDANGGFSLFNPASIRFHNISNPQNLIGKVPSGSDLYTSSGEPLSPEQNPLMRAFKGEHVKNERLVVAPRGGKRRDIIANAQALTDKTGAKIGAVVAMRDVTEQLRYEAKLADLALHDPLTGVANRLLLMDRLQKAFDWAEREKTSVAVLLLDLNDFKTINDQFGHSVGDEVLVSIANRFKAALRPTDTLARLGGDEFVVVCNLDAELPDPEPIKKRIVAALNLPVKVGESVKLISASIGEAIHKPGDVGSPEDLLIKADNDMYKQKLIYHGQKH
jgi:diguanylate cyclase (GGDEF)-like protein/PAS domain S-box-containing protein